MMIMWVSEILVVARVTVESEELRAAMLREDAQAPARFTLVVPRQMSGARAAIEEAFRLQAALNWATGCGLEVRGWFGDSDPVIAAAENFEPWRIDKIIVCTSAAGVSHWCGADVAARIRRLTGAPVIQVEGSRPAVADVPFAAAA